MKKLMSLCYFLLFITLASNSVMADSSEYEVIDIISGYQISSVESIEEANEIYESEKANFDELAIFKDDKIIKVEHGIISIPTDEVGCTYNYEYTNELTMDSGYTNGCYGRDALYLGTNDSGTRINFMISGAKAWGSIEDVEIIPLSKITQLTSYTVIDGVLYHQIKSDLSSSKYASLIALGTAPIYLKEGDIVLSYDGHYFYTTDNFSKMSEDVLSGSYRHAINEDSPFYNYYQYVTHRTLTNISDTMFNDYLYDTLMISGPVIKYNDQNKDSVHDVLTESQYYNYGSSFFQNQNIFGSNAMMMLALSMNESATGRSSLAYTRNNLFGHAAYDSDVEANASRYLNVFSSVYSHAKNYISNSYLEPNKFQYHGGFFGNKASGMNVSYASDPYWGEKAAQNYYLLDEKFGFLDLNSYALGVSTSAKSISVFDQDGDVLYHTGYNPHMSFVILQEESNYYKIQTDPSLVHFSNIDGSYDFTQNVGYILKSDIDLLLNEDKIKEDDYVVITLDANGGLFNNGLALIKQQVRVNDEICSEIPTIQNGIFTGWDKELGNAEKNELFVANYRTVDSIEMATLPPTILEYYDRLDLTGGSIQVNYSDGETEIVSLTSSMVSNYDIKLVEKQEVLVTYAGCTTTYLLEVLMELDEERLAIIDKREQLMAKLSETTEFSEEDYTSLVELNKMQLDYGVPWFNHNSMRSLDEIYYNAYHDNLYTVILENEVNLSVSGLYYNADIPNIKDKFLFKDTIRIAYNHEISDESFQMLHAVAKGNDYEYINSFSINGTYNSDNLVLNDYILVSLDIPNDVSSNQIITVLQYVDGNVVRLSTEQTLNKVIFKTNELGTYAIVSKNSTNEYTSADKIEICTYENNHFNKYELISVLKTTLILGIFGIIVLLGLKGILRKKK